MFYWWMSQGTLSTNVKEVCISQDIIVFNRQKWVQNLRNASFLNMINVNVNVYAQILNLE